MLLKEKLQEFKNIYKNHCGIDLTDDKARNNAENMISLLGMIYKAITKEEHEKNSQE